MSLTRSTIRLSMLAALLALGSACGSSSTSPTTAADVTISMVGNLGSNSFAPNPTTMKVGQSVAWMNNDTIAHDATQDAGRFTTGTLNAGATSSPVPMA